MHLKVQVWIHNGDQVLVFQLTPERGGFWQPVTGGVEPGESLEQAALREAEEETGLSYVQKPQPIGHSHSFTSRWGGECEEHAFALQAPADRLVQLDPTEHVAYEWVSPEQALARVKHASNAEALKLWLASR